jgi:hypothetical protein
MLDDVVKGGVEGFIRGLLARKADESTGQIEAQSFVLRDGKGRGRAVLAMLEEGPGLTLLNAREEIKAVLGLDKEGAHLQFWGKDRPTNVLVRMDGDEPELVFFDARDEPRASLRLYRNGPCLRLWDSKGKCRVMLQMDDKDGPSVVVYDENETPVQQLRPQTDDEDS